MYPDKYPDCLGEAIKIYYQKKEKYVMCYAARDNQYGWCGICNPNAKIGESGYCPYLDYWDDESMEWEGHEIHKNEYVNVKTAKNWGFCSKQCQASYGLFPKKLQETKISFLHDNDCEVFQSPSVAGNQDILPITIIFFLTLNQFNRK